MACTLGLRAGELREAVTEHYRAGGIFLSSHDAVKLNERQTREELRRE